MLEMVALTELGPLVELDPRVELASRVELGSRVELTALAELDPLALGPPASSGPKGLLGVWSYMELNTEYVKPSEDQVPPQNLSPEIHCEMMSLKASLQFFKGLLASSRVTV